ncbi:DUF371 domain-containing protein [Conexivisphaera calida]|uniref:DUF371 domain-containing protein n=1 Tax=Conexivisphaera calida TaxID=1874277 RepID=A0A4P2VAX7_9ARCH|nr:DUF371 domain-containing protein [Conexivisphaera calida]BBE41654.1 Uncharacterized protein NAS2_0261 [Conexivisphaera calida]
MTTEDYLTPRGDCIIGIRADKGAAGLSEEIKRHIRLGDRLRLEIIVGELSFAFDAWGSPSLELSDARSAVIRRSSFASPRTIAVRSTAVARDIPRDIVSELRTGRRGVLAIYVL